MFTLSRYRLFSSMITTARRRRGGGGKSLQSVAFSRTRVELLRASGKIYLKRRKETSTVRETFAREYGKKEKSPRQRNLQISHHRELTFPRKEILRLSLFYFSSLLIHFFFFFFFVITNTPLSRREVRAREVPI